MKLFFRSLSVASVLPALLFVVPGVGHAQEEEVVLVVGGDIEWSRITKAPGIAFDLEERSPGDWVRIPYLVTSETTPSLEAVFGRELSTPESHHVLAIHYGLEFDSVEEMIRYPLLRIAPVLRDADIAFANLETPLSDQARHSGAFAHRQRLPTVSGGQASTLSRRLTTMPWMPTGRGCWIPKRPCGVPASDRSGRARTSRMRGGRSSSRKKASALPSSDMPGR